MAEQWITAAQALKITGDVFAICARLHAGMIRARARVLQIGADAVADMLVPKQLWWAQGHEALEQDWQAGDFATWFNRDQRIEAHGVSFELSDVLEMINPERRPIIARSLSVAGNPDWVSALEARRLLCATLGHNPARAGQAIIEQAKLGFIAARAVMAEGRTRFGDAPPKWQEREWDVPGWFWGEFDVSAPEHSWAQGNFTGDGHRPDGVTRIFLHGVHFYRDSLSVSDEASDAVPTVERPAGRKPIYDWDAATTAIWGMIYRGELIPKNQADLEKALQLVLAKGDKEPGESTVRPHAKRVWEELSK